MPKIMGKADIWCNGKYLGKVDCVNIDGKPTVAAPVTVSKSIDVECTFVGLSEAEAVAELFDPRTPLERMADKIGDMCCQELRRIDRKWRRSR